MRVSYTFDEVKRKVAKTGKCSCGKRLSRSTTFSQTVNPYNKNKDGFPKTRAEIYMELHQEAEEWQPVFVCSKCEEANDQT